MFKKPHCCPFRPLQSRIRSLFSRPEWKTDDVELFKRKIRHMMEAKQYQEVYNLLAAIDFSYLAVGGDSEFVSSIRARLTTKLGRLEPELLNLASLGNSRIRDSDLDKAIDAYQQGECQPPTTPHPPYFFF